MTKAFLFFAGLVLANIAPALIYLPPPEYADVIAVVRVMSLSPTSDQRVLVNRNWPGTLAREVADSMK